MAGSEGKIVERYGEDRIQAFESAAGKRLEEAEFLSTNGFNHAAVYLFGYVTELLLKAACFRYGGLGHSDPITKERREDIAKKAQVFRHPTHRTPRPARMVSFADRLSEITQANG